MERKFPLARFAARGSPPRHAKEAPAGDPGLQREEEIVSMLTRPFASLSLGLKPRPGLPFKRADVPRKRTGLLPTVPLKRD